MIEVRASLSGLATILGAGIGASVSGLISGFFRGHTGAQLLVPSLVAVGITLLVALAFRYNSRVSVEADSIAVRTLIGYTHRFAIEDVALVVDARHVDTGFSPSGRIAFLNVDGIALLRLRSNYWNRDGLRALTGSFGEKRVVLPELLTAHELIELYPLALDFRTRRPFLNYGLLIVGVAALAIGYVWLLEVLAV